MIWNFGNKKMQKNGVNRSSNWSDVQLQQYPLQKKAQGGAKVVKI
jgi:hypothetical protein